MPPGRRSRRRRCRRMRAPTRRRYSGSSTASTAAWISTPAGSASHLDRHRAARCALHRGAHAGARRFRQALQDGPADRDPRVSVPAGAGLRLGRHAGGRRAGRHGPEVQPAGRPHAAGGVRAGAAGRDHDAAARRHRRRQQDVEVARATTSASPRLPTACSARSCRSRTSSCGGISSCCHSVRWRDRGPAARGRSRPQSARHQARAGPRDRGALSRRGGRRARAAGLHPG